jgi:hypothetical protein
MPIVAVGVKHQPGRAVFLFQADRHGDFKG